MLNKLKELAQQGIDVRSIAFAPNSGWAIVYKGGTVTSAIPEEMLNKLKELAKQGIDVQSIAFAPNSGWIILYNGGAWFNTIP
jgi:hypothetical protein